MPAKGNGYVLQIDSAEVSRIYGNNCEIDSSFFTANNKPCKYLGEMSGGKAERLHGIVFEFPNIYSSILLLVKDFKFNGEVIVYSPLDTIAWRLLSYSGIEKILQEQEKNG